MLRRYPVLALVVAIGVAASALLLWARHRLEAAYTTVEIVLDSEDWMTLALREGADPDVYFRDLRSAGAVSVALYDGTLKRWNAAGLVGIADAATAAADSRIVGQSAALRGVASRGLLVPGRVIVAPRRDLLPVVRDALVAALGADRVTSVGDVLVVRGRFADVQETGLGYLPGDADRWRRLDFALVLRPRNFRGLSEATLARRFALLGRVGGARTLIFEGTEVLGFDRLIPQAAEAMRKGDLRFGRVEIFSAARRQKGEDRLADLVKPKVIRVFSVTPEEMATLSVGEVLAKFSRAPRERNIRILYVRPFLQLPAGEDSLAANLEFVRSLAREVRAAGFTTGRAQPLAPLALPRGLVWVVAAGALAAGAMLLGEIARGSGLRPSERPLLALVVAGLAAVVLLRLLGAGVLWRQLVALSASLAAPTLAVLRASPRERDAAPSFADAARRSVGALWVISVGSAAGGLLVAASLSEWSFMMAANIFVGVKVAYVVPVLLVGVFLWSRDAPNVWRRVVTLGGQPLLLQYALLVLVIGAAALFILARTGNVSLPLLDVEERVRNAAEAYLVARPRTKEYLLGHPAMILAAAAALGGARRWVVPLAMVGAIGQVGLLNSFSHIHTPVLYVLWRTANGLVVGTAVGLIALAVVWPFAVRLGWVRVAAAPARAPTA